MICEPCRDKRHQECPSLIHYHEYVIPVADEKRPGLTTKMTRPPTGLSKENEVVQRSGLCPCQHKVTLMNPITLEEAEEKIRVGVKQNCGCGGLLSTGPEEPRGEQAEFVKLWFEDHSYEDLNRHGRLVTAKTQAMRAAAK